MWMLPTGLELVQACSVFLGVCASEQDFASAGKGQQWHWETGIWNHIFWLIKAILSMLLPVSVNLFSRRFLNGALQEGRAWLLLGTGGSPEASPRQVYSWALATFEWHFHLCRLPHKAHSAQFAHEPRSLFHFASEVWGALFSPHSKQPPQASTNSQISSEVFLPRR